MTLNTEFTDILRVKGINAQGFGTIAKLVMKDRRITAQAKAIYAYISAYAGSGTTAFPSVELMCEDLGMKDETLLKHRRQLEQCGYLNITRERNKKGQWGRNIYELAFYPIEQEIEPTPENPGMDEPTPDLPTPDYPSMVNPAPANRGTIINSSITNSLIINNQEKKEEEEEEHAGAESNFPKLLFDPRLKEISEAWYTVASTHLNKMQMDEIAYFMDVDKCELGFILELIHSVGLYSYSKHSGGKFKFFVELIVEAMNDGGCRTAAEYGIWKKSKTPPKQQAVGGYQDNSTHNSYNKNKLPAPGVTGLRIKDGVENKSYADIYDVMNFKRT